MVKIKRELSNIFLKRSGFHQPFKQKQNKNISRVLGNAFNIQNRDNFYIIETFFELISVTKVM